MACGPMQTWDVVTKFDSIGTARQQFVQTPAYGVRLEHLDVLSAITILALSSFPLPTSM